MGWARVGIRMVWFGLALTLLTAVVTGVFLASRDLMAMGGSCASGGPYEVANECPDGTGLLLGGGIPAGIVATFAVLALGSRLPGRYGELALLAWPAFFLSLGWNFLEFGLDPPGAGGVDAALLLCAVIFAVLGGLPLLAMTGGARRVLWPAEASDAGGATRRSDTPKPATATPASAGREDRTPTGTEPATRRRSGHEPGQSSAESARPERTAPQPPAAGSVTTDQGDRQPASPEPGAAGPVPAELGDPESPRPEPSPPAPAAAGAAAAATLRPASPAAPQPAPDPRPQGAPAGSLATELERLAALHAAGALDAEEFARAKAVALSWAEGELATATATAGEPGPGKGGRRPAPTEEDHR